MVLPFQSSIIDKIASCQRCLSIIGRGLGSVVVLKGLIKKMEERPEGLFLLLCTSQEEAQNLDITVLDLLSPVERQAAYVRGGVVCVNARLLAVDMLQARLSLEVVLGVIVNHAHKVTSTDSPNAFILREIRRHSKKSCVWALSDRFDVFNPSDLDQQMSVLGAEHLFLWPRIHEQVAKILDSTSKATNGLIQKMVPLPPSMQTIQKCLLDLVQDVLEEVRKSKPVEVAFDGMESKEVLFKSFTRKMRTQLTPQWHELGPNTRRLLYDLGNFSELFRDLFRLDCIDFWRRVQLCVDTGTYASPWSFSPPAQELLRCAKARVYTHELVLEAHAKWDEVVAIITAALKPPTAPVMEDGIINLDDDDLESGPAKKVKLIEPKIVIVVPDEKTQAAMEVCVARGSSYVLLDYFCAFSEKSRDAHARALHAACRRKLEDSSARGVSGIQSTGNVRVHPSIEVLVQGMRVEQRITDDVDVLILFEAHLEVVRQVEVHCADRHSRGVPLPNVHMLVFRDSIELFRFQQSLHKETRMVDSLVHARKRLMIRVEDTLEAEQLAKDMAADREGSTRKAGGQQLLEVQSSIVVDLREFRAVLPYHLHRHFRMLPQTLIMGDYVLSRDICVERKALADLIGSLKSGRLFTQAENLVCAYQSPTLLIEFDPSKGFSLLPHGRKIDAHEVVSQMAVLMMHFPKLRFLWSPSQKWTAQMFVKLKKGRCEPDIKERKVASLRNLKALDALRKLPGITPQNIMVVTQKCASISALCQKSRTDLEELLGPQNAEKLHTFLHHT